jgi:hypothetical protein
MFKYLKVLPLTFFSGYSCSNNVLENFIEINNANEKVYFIHSNGKEDKLKALSVSFYEKNSCQGQYLAHSITEAASELPLQPNQTFSLSMQSVYQLALSVFNEANISKIGSVLIRFSNQDGQWTRFISSCQLKDDDTACCVNVHCHPSELNCDLNLNEFETHLP